ncbi:MAG: hypothetical protein C0432_03925 [Candidatus Puniceispirillum sp.]|nr:hypothetical protein [Candidatus Pelagibacter sp.]MBA4283424.1 hypothetical protein [Candidatus Puniceispirillum sp.]
MYSLLKKTALIFLVCLSTQSWAIFSFFKDKKDIHSQESYSHMQKYVVSIEIRSIEAAYTSLGTKYGTGSVVDKENGIIVTNRHVACPDSVVERYDVTLFDGSVVTGRLLYSDPWHDFAFLKVDPKDIQQIPHSLPLREENVSLGESVMIIGKNENKHFSVQTGTVASPFEIAQDLSGQTFRISLNAQGGASGSPVLDEKGNAAGLLFSSNGSTGAYALPMKYIAEALSALKKKATPSRFGMGIVFDLVSLNDLMRYDGFDSKKALEYSTKYPDAFSRILVVKSVLKNSPAYQKIQSGDVLMQIQGKECGPSHYDVDQIMNTEGAKGSKEIQICVIRNGKPLKINIPLYDLQKNKIARFIVFGKAVFVEADDFMSQLTGSEKSVFISKTKPGGSFFDKLPCLGDNDGTGKCLIRVSNIKGNAIKTLDDVKDAILKLAKISDFSIMIYNFGAEMGYDRQYFFSQHEQIKYISHHAGIEEHAVEFIFNEKNGKWDRNEIVVK